MNSRSKLRLIAYLITVFCLFLGCEKENISVREAFTEIEGTRWILTETINGWTGEVIQYDALNSPEALFFRTDSTFTQIRPDIDCLKEGTFRKIAAEPMVIELEYLPNVATCNLFFQFPNYLTLEDGKLIQDSRPTDGPKYTYERK